MGVATDVKNRGIAQPIKLFIIGYGMTVLIHHGVLISKNIEMSMATRNYFAVSYYDVGDVVTHVILTFSGSIIFFSVHVIEVLGVR